MSDAVGLRGVKLDAMFVATVLTNEARARARPVRGN